MGPAAGPATAVAAPMVPRAGLLVATRSRHKLRELAELLDLPPGVELLSPDDLGIDGEPDETGLTFETNARIKARYYAARSGLPTLADDSGLEVDALDGGPGRLHPSLRRPGRHRRRQQREAAPRARRACRPIGAARATCACSRSRCRAMPVRAAACGS